MRRILVKPFGDGWTVRSDGFENDMVFKRGRDAENAAKRLGRQMSAWGQVVEIEVCLRDGEIAGRFTFTPEPSVEA